MNMAKTGNMPMNMKHKSRLMEISRMEVDSILRSGLPTGDGDEEGEFSDFFESLFGSRRGKQTTGWLWFPRTGFIQPNYILTLREAAETHKQILTVNGKNLRITVPAWCGRRIKPSNWQVRVVPV